jgi:drug/metabolite transporter (DMT)-like permease
VVRYLALLLALAAAISFGAAAVAQHRSTKKVQARGVMHPWLIADLARRPAWVAAVAASTLGYLLQAAALHFGPLSFVQPLLVSGLLFAVGFGTLMRRQRLDRVLVAGAVCCGAGLVGFLAIARPRGGAGLDIDLSNGLPLAGAFALIVAVCLVVAHHRRGAVRSLTLALACGILYGVNAFLLKSVTDLLATGIVAVLVSWPLYAAVVLGPAGFLLNQTAFQAGRLATPVLAVITAVDPLVSILIARVWFGEHFAPGLWRAGPEIFFFALMTAGVVALASRMPHPGDQAGSGHGAFPDVRSPGKQPEAIDREKPMKRTGHNGFADLPWRHESRTIL